MSEVGTNDNLFLSAAEGNEGLPDFNALFDDEESGGGGAATATDSFVKIDKVLGEAKTNYFANTNFYQDILVSEGEIAKRVHATLAAFLKAEDPEEKSAQRQRLVPLIWELAKSVAKQAGGKLPDPKRIFLRFGLLLPTMIDKEQRQLLCQIPTENTTGQPIHYVDDWLRLVAQGQVGTSSTDETTPAARGKGGNRSALQADAAKGKMEGQLDLIRTQNREMETLEHQLEKLVQSLVARDPLPNAPGERGPYSESQRALFTDIGSVMRQLSNAGRELSKACNELERYQESYESLRRQAEEEGSIMATVDTEAAAAEMGTVRQMAKMAVGRQGNHFPLLFKQYFRGGILGMATRETVNNILAQVEYLDPNCFKRTFKQKTNRIVPNVILIPCYGEFGVCWEPFERFNRATSRGRIAIPMYPKEPKAAVIAAVGDLRWQVAKERAAHYWMEEGLTGWYYQWFTEAKMRGDVKDQFIQDYLLWIAKESEGTQKLAREVRDIFWRYMPFPQELKDELKNRGFVYSELYKKDQNRAMSDGY